MKALRQKGNGDGATLLLIQVLLVFHLFSLYICVFQWYSRLYHNSIIQQQLRNEWRCFRYVFKLKKVCHRYASEVWWWLFFPICAKSLYNEVLDRIQFAFSALLFSILYGNHLIILSNSCLLHLEHFHDSNRPVVPFSSAKQLSNLLFNSIGFYL